jgi:hypothetical protein
MRVPGLLVAGGWLVTAAVGAADVVHRSFDQEAMGTPAGFLFAAARLPEAGRWTVRSEGSNRFLAHAAQEGTGEGFALALISAPPPADLRLSARVKLAEGAPVGGLVWRYQDPENFHAVALDLGAQEVSLYRVARGNRIRLEFEDDLELDRDAWHMVRVEHRDGRIRVSLGGIGIMRARAREDGAGPGRAGVWAAGPSGAWFDDLGIEQAVERER